MRFDRVRLVGHLHGDRVRSERLDRVADDESALVDLGAGLGDRGRDVGDGDGAEEAAALAARTMALIVVPSSLAFISCAWSGSRTRAAVARP